MNSQSKLFYLFIFIGACGIFLFQVNENSIHQHWVQLFSYGIIGVSVIAGFYLFYFRNDSIPSLLKIEVIFLLVVMAGFALGFFSSVIHQKWLGLISLGIVMIGFAGMLFCNFSLLGARVQNFIDLIKSLFE